MRKAKQVIPFIKNHCSVRTTDFYKSLSDIKDGRIAQWVLRQCEAGLSPQAFAKLKADPKFARALPALMAVLPNHTAEEHSNILEDSALTFHRLKKHDGKIPWELYGKAYPCLLQPEMEPTVCRGHRHCERVLSRNFNSVLSAVLMRTDILSRDGGIFADRLLTAIECGVPLERIRKVRSINFPVALEVLREFFPDIDEKMIEDYRKEYDDIY